MNGPHNSIGWCDYTINPAVGCLRGCSYCYGRLRVAPRLASRCALCGTYTPHFHPERLAEPAKVKRPSRIFVGSLADLFGPWVPDAWMEQILQMVRSTPWHRFQFLTKYPERLSRWEWPSNVWVGATATDSDSWLTACDALSSVDAPIRYISYEPFMELPSQPWRLGDGDIEWLIIGAMTGPGASEHWPLREWVEEIVDAAKRAGVPVFMKNNLAPVMGPDYKLRQEWPEVPK